MSRKYLRNEKKKAQKNFFQIAYGSLKECKAILDLSVNPPQSVISLADILGAHIYKLIKNAR